MCGPSGASAIISKDEDFFYQTPAKRQALQEPQIPYISYCSADRHHTLFYYEDPHGKGL